MTDKKADAWMPLWIGSYLADTLHLTTVQHGAYLLLLMAYWRERAALPDDDDQLRSVAKLDRAEWKRIRPVLAKFFRVADGIWWHKRVEHELADAEARSKKASEKAAKAAQARWQASPEQTASNAPSNAPSIPQALLEDMHEECPTPSPSKDISKASPSHPPAKPDGQKTPTVPCPYDAIVEAYHELLPSMPRVQLRDGPTWTERQKAMRTVWAWVLSSKRPDGSRRAESADDAMSWLRDYFAQASENDFLMGRTERTAKHKNWRCDLDFLLTTRGMKQVIEKTQEAA